MVGRGQGKAMTQGAGEGGRTVAAERGRDEPMSARRQRDVQEIQALPPPVHRAIKFLALYDRPLPRAELERVLGDTTDVDAAIASGWLREGPAPGVDGAALLPLDPVLREDLRARMTPETKWRLEEAVLQLLEGDDALPFRVALGGLGDPGLTADLEAAASRARAEGRREDALQLEAWVAAAAGRPRPGAAEPVPRPEAAEAPLAQPDSVRRPLRFGDQMARRALEQLRAGRLDLARLDLELARDYTLRSDDAGVVARQRLLEGMLDFHLGRYDATLHAAATVVDLARWDPLAAPYCSLAHSVVAHAQAARGEHAIALRELELARQTLDPRLPDGPSMLAGARAFVARLAGDPAGVLDALTVTHDALRRGRTEGLHVGAAWFVVDALIALGRIDEAADAAVPLDRLSEAPPVTGHLGELRARLAEARGDFETAETEYRAALAERPALDLVFSRAQLEASAARLLARRGHELEAAALARRSEHRFEALGVPPGTHRPLALGPTEEAEGWWRDSGLSKREVDVAVGAGRGLSNREIADRMAISTRTVDFHMRNVLRKLGMTSRRDVRERWI